MTIYKHKGDCWTLVSCYCCAGEQWHAGRRYRNDCGEIRQKHCNECNGVTEINLMKPGMYHVQFAGGGYLLQTLKLTVPRGKIIEVKVKMVKK